MKLKIIFVLFGLLMGAGAGGIFYFVYHRAFHQEQRAKGIEFNSNADFRAQMLDDKKAARANRSDGVSFASIINPNADDRIIYELRPNLDTRFTSVHVRTNSCGMRGPERPYAKPPGTYRIALLGDSFAFGWGVEENQSFAQILEDELNRLTGGYPKVEVLNFGVPGYSTFQEVALFEEKGLEYDPDAVLVFFIDNDFDYPFFVRDNSSPNGVVESFSLSHKKKHVDPKLTETKNIMRGLEPQKMLGELMKIDKPRGIKTFLTINPRRNWEWCLKRLSKSLAENEIDYIDLVPDFDRVVADHGYTDNDLNLPNDLHPSVIRSRIYGELLTPPLWAEIERARPEFAQPQK